MHNTGMDETTLHLKREQTRRTRVKVLAWSTIVGILIYLALVGTLHVLRPDYNPLYNAESDFAVGPYSFLMTIAFFVRGLLSFALIGGLLLAVPPAARSRSGIVFLSIWSVGALILGCVPTDLENTPHHTIHGAIHLLAALLAFTSILLAAFQLMRRFRRSSQWEALGRQLRVITILLFITFVGMWGTLGVELATNAVGFFGLLERIFIGLSLLWIFLVARRLLGK